MPMEHLDVLVVGAGLSGISAGYHLQARCPGRRYAILEARAALGGTWDLFRYPGIRSDSDMYTLGYSFQPWRAPKAIADGPAILDYLKQTAAEYGIDRHIRFQHRVRSASWSGADSKWTVEVERGESREPLRLSCGFLFFCSGYYDYAEGYTPEFPGIAQFAGQVVHPQQWRGDIDYAGKRVVVIGSGATAVTLVPNLAQTAAQVIMLQRSPSYVVSLPQRDGIADNLRRWLPAGPAYSLARWKNVLLGMVFYAMCKRAPQLLTRVLLRAVRTQLGPDYDVARHFTPRYKPWDQRLCLVPNGDLFRAIRAGRAEVVTDEIETFTAGGIRLRSGRVLDADLVVTATGLKLQALGGARLSVDGRAVELAKTLSYKGMMLSGVPNMAIALGYTNASWTLKCDLTSAYVCRLLNHMQRRGLQQCAPRSADPGVAERPFIDFTAGYVLRSLHLFPKQGSKAPWRLYQNYLLDLLALRFGTVEDGVMDFSGPHPPLRAAQSAAG